MCRDLLTKFAFVLYVRTIAKWRAACVLAPAQQMHRLFGERGSNAKHHRFGIGVSVTVVAEWLGFRPTTSTPPVHLPFHKRSRVWEVTRYVFRHVTTSMGTLTRYAIQVLYCTHRRIFLVVARSSRRLTGCYRGSRLNGRLGARRRGHESVPRVPFARQQHGIAN